MNAGLPDLEAGDGATWLHDDAVQVGVVQTFPLTVVCGCVESTRPGRRFLNLQRRSRWSLRSGHYKRQQST